MLVAAQRAASACCASCHSRECSGWGARALATPAPAVGGPGMRVMGRAAAVCVGGGSQPPPPRLLLLLLLRRPLAALTALLGAGDSTAGTLWPPASLEGLPSTLGVPPSTACSNNTGAGLPGGAASPAATAAARSGDASSAAAKDTRFALILQSWPSGLLPCPATLLPLAPAAPAHTGGTGRHGTHRSAGGIGQSAAVSGRPSSEVSELREMDWSQAGRHGGASASHAE